MGFLSRFFRKRATITFKVEECDMGFKMTGVWQRKDVEFPTQEALGEAVLLVKMNPLWTIKTTPKLRDKYAALYGSDELPNLDNNNMVQSPDKESVKGGVWVPLPPKPAPRDMLMEEVAEGITVLEAMVERVVMKCLARAFPERF